MNDIIIRLRLIIIKKNKVLLTYDSEENYYFYIGGKLEHGETVIEGATREVKEECDKTAKFAFNKILYVRDFIDKTKNIHSLELFILGDINKFHEIENKKDPQFNGRKWLKWIEIEKLPDNLYPTQLTKKLLMDYHNGFPNQGEYIGKI